MRKSLLILILLIGCAGTYARINYHSFISITRKEGLASNDVYDIVQDDRGFYWIATDNGLQRYDGKRWVSPTSGDDQTVPVKPIQQIIPVGNSRLLLKIGDVYGVFNTINFRFNTISIKKPAGWNGETTLLKDSRNRTFLLIKGFGFLLFNNENLSFSQAGVPFNLPVNIKPYGFFEDQDKQHFWFSGRDGIYVYDETKKQLYNRGNNPLNLPLIDDERFTHVQTIFIDQSRNHWVVYGNNNQQYASYSEASKKYNPEVFNLPRFYKGKFRIDQVFQSAEAEVWLFGRSALFNYVPEENSFFNNKSDIVRNFGARFSTVRRIMQDREKGIWIATDEGLYQTYTVLPEVRNVVLQTDNDDNNITDVQEMSNGEIWLSSRGKGLIPMDSNHRRVRIPQLYAGIDTARNKALKLANTMHLHALTGKLWTGCDDGYLMVYDVEKSRMDLLRPDLLKFHSISDITEDATGELYIATADGLVVKYDPRFSSFSEVASVNSKVNRLMIDTRQQLWIATEGDGLFSYDIASRSRVMHYRKNSGAPGSLSSDRVRAIAQLNDSIYAVATDVFELINVKSGTSEIITYKDGLIGNTILNMQKDRQGYLWLATSNGICRFNYSRRKFTVYEERDGFMRYETVGTSAAMLANGKIFFGGSNLFVTFPPDQLNIQQVPPSVIMTDFKVLNSYVPLDSSVDFEFSHDNNSVALYFSAVSYLQKDKLTYYYRLKGIDKDWAMSNNQLAAIYTLLPSGDFVFEVRCENEDGISSPVTTFGFRINPPFWKTWWFILIVLGAIGALLFLFHRTRVNRVIALSDLRNRVARDLHDDVGSTLSTISILSTIAKGKLTENPVQAEQYISKITDNSQQMMDAMDDIVWSIKPMNDSMQKIVARMREFASGTLEPKNIDVDFIVDEKVLELKLNMESRRDLFLIFKEAVNNAAKYSGASHISIQFSYIRQRLLLKIKDNGTGFDVASADSGNGLSNMKKRAAMLSGRIRWFSEPGNGTVVLLNIPVNA